MRSWGNEQALSFCRATAILVALSFVLVLFPTHAIETREPFAPPSLAQNGPSLDWARCIEINGYRFDPVSDASPVPPSLRYGSNICGQAGYYLVEFEVPIGAVEKTSVQDAEVRILHYAGHNTYVVWADSGGLTQMRSAPNIRWFGLFEPAYKLSPRLTDEYESALATPEDQRLEKRSASTSGQLNLAPGMSSAFGVHDAPARDAAVLGGDQVQGASIHGTRLQIVVLAFEASVVNEALHAIVSFGGTNVSIQESNRGIITAEIGEDVLELLAFEPSIMWIDRKAEVRPYNDVARWVLQSGDATTFATPVHDLGIYGTDQTVTVCDTGIDYNHSAFSDPSNPMPGPANRKVTAYYVPQGAPGDSKDIDDCHGTHVSGTVAGDDGIWHMYDGDAKASNATVGPHDGQAFDAYLQVQDIYDGNSFGPPSWIGELYWEAMERGSWIHTNSWGIGGADYGIDAMFNDEFVWENQDMVVVFAAGNDGKYDRALNSMASSKNVISVGASVNGLGSDNMAFFSSRGPTLDGRMKPDVIAPGLDIWSARGNYPFFPGSDYWQMSGTSMATPMVAGAAALVREYFMSGWYPTGQPEMAHDLTPSAALVKATIINSAREMNGFGAYDMGQRRYPNNNQGWGLVTLDDALYFRGDGRRLAIQDDRTGLLTGDLAKYELKVADVTTPLEITLVWSDYPAEAWASPILVNDLDLIVTAPDGTVYRGNAFTGYDPGQSEPDATSNDHMNNVESVLLLSDVQTGIWTVEVSGFNVPQGPQPFALAMTGGFASDQGLLSIENEMYRSSSLVNVTLSDLGLNLDSGSVESVVVAVNSLTEPIPELLTLVETGNSTAVFVGKIPLAGGLTPTLGDGLLQVQDGDEITAEYFDADDGFGAGRYVHDWAMVDDAPPVISDVRVGGLRFSRATVLWSTDEPADSTVFCGHTLPLDMISGTSSVVSSHEISLVGLQENTEYYYSVTSADLAGNVQTDDNGGNLYSFLTPGRPSPTALSGDWPTLRANNARSGAVESDMTPPLVERITMGPYLIGSAYEPIFADGLFYTIINGDGSVMAIDPFSALVLWNRQLGGELYYTGAPAYHNGTLYATLYGNDGGKVYALDALTGETDWSIGWETGLDFDARIAMAYADGLVFGTSWNGEVYALNASDGSVAWFYQTDLHPWIGATVSAGRVIVPACTSIMPGGDGELLALDEFSGTPLWSLRVPGLGYGLLPLVSGDRIYMFALGTLYSINASDGSVLWQIGGYTVGWGGFSPAFDGSTLYWGALNTSDMIGYFIAVNASDGGITWRTPVGSTDICRDIAYSNGYVYGASHDGDLYSLRADDGSVVDVDRILGSPWGFLINVIASDGWIWVEDEDGWLRGYQAQVPAGLTVSPVHQSADASPGTNSDREVLLTNVGAGTEDTFDAYVTLGSHGWPVAILDNESMIPLTDTDSDGVVDTGPIPANGTIGIVIRLSIPPSSEQGDEELTSVGFRSSKDVSVWRNATVRTRLPGPGVILDGSRYISSAPGDSECERINVRNSGAQDDVFDLDVRSRLGWSVELLDASGTVPLQDNDGDGSPDTGTVPGLSSVNITVRVQVPTDAPPDAVERVTFEATSYFDSRESSIMCLRIETAAPPEPAWPVFNHDNRRSGATADPVSLPIREEWTYRGTDAGSYYTSPVVANGTVFYCSSGGYMMAVDAITGVERWVLRLANETCDLSAPTYHDGAIYVAYGQTDSFGYRLSAIDSVTGSILWTNFTFGWIRGAPVFKGGMVFLADSYGVVYSFNASSGERLWVVQGPSLMAWSMSIIDGLLVGGGTSGDLFAMDLDGSMAWTRPVTSFLPQGAIMSAPCGGDGKVYVSETGETLWALDSQTGETVWSRWDVGFVALGTPAYDNGTVYYASQIGVFAFDSDDGSLRWHALGSYTSGPILSNNTLFVCGSSSFLSVLDARTGRILYELPVSVASGCTPASAYGRVYVTGASGVLSSFTYAGGPDLPPVAEAGPDRFIDQGVTVICDGSGSTDDYDIVNYTWTIVELGERLYGITAARVFFDVGEFTIELVVRDNFGRTSTDSFLVSVRDTTNPVASAGPDRTIDLGEIAVFDGSGSSDNVGIVNWTWYYVQGYICTEFWGEVASHEFAESGNYSVTLVVRDAQGWTGSDDVIVNVNAAPVAEAGSDIYVNQGRQVTLDGSASTDDVGVVNYSWSFDDSGPVLLWGAIATYTFNTGGNYSVTLDVRDCRGLASSDVMIVRVNAAPGAEAGDDLSTVVGIPVIFDGSLSADDSGIANYTWTFDYNGTPVTIWGVSPSFVFWTATAYNVTLTVTDGHGLNDSDTILVTVTMEIPEFTSVLAPAVGMMLCLAVAALVSRHRKKKS